MRTQAAGAITALVLAACTPSGPAQPEEATPTATPGAASGVTQDGDAPDCDLSWPEPDCARAVIDAVRAPIAAGPNLLVASVGRDVVGWSPLDGTELWRFTPPDASLVSTGAQVVPQGVLLTQAPPESRTGAVTTLLDASTGRPVWEASGFTAQAEGDAEVAGLVADSQFIAVELATGQELWRRPLDDLFFGAALHGDDALVSGPDGLALLDARTGAVRWLLEDAERAPTIGGPGEVGDDLVVARVGGERVLLDRATGEQVSSTPLPDRVTAIGGAIVSLANEAVTGLDRGGSSAWELPGRPIIARGGAALLVGIEQGGREQIALADPSTGDVLWQVRADRDVGQVVADDTHIAIERTGSVVLLDRATGQERHRLRGNGLSVVSLTPFVVTVGERVVIIEE